MLCDFEVLIEHEVDKVELWRGEPEEVFEFE